MIKTEELMRNNWVNEEVLGNVQVDTILSASIWVTAININTDGSTHAVRYHIKADAIYPIPLSPEILLACGFTKFIDMEISQKEKRDIYMYFLKTDYVQITFVFGSTVLIGNDGFGKQAQCDISGKVKCLHQLQNLHFSLTHKELIYKP